MDGTNQQPQSPQPINPTPAFNSSKSKAPILVTIISWLILFAGLSSSLGTLWGVWASTFLSGLVERAGIEDIGTIPNINYVSIGISIILGIGFVIVAYGLGRMHKWALYAFTVLTIIMVIILVYSYMIFPKQNLSIVLSPVIEVLSLIYLWSISKKFV